MEVPAFILRCQKKEDLAVKRISNWNHLMISLLHSRKIDNIWVIVISKVGFFSLFEYIFLNPVRIKRELFSVFKSTREEMEYCLEKSGFNVESVMDECCIRLRGLPFGCTNDDIIQFFSGIHVNFHSWHHSLSFVWFK